MKIICYDSNRNQQYIPVNFHQEYRIESYLPTIHSHWIELHIQQNPTQEWFNDWVNRIPNYSCSCRANFQQILEQHPPPLPPENGLEGKQTHWFEWTVLVHNKVNEKLGKPILSLNEAKSIWNVQTVDVK